jgi:hypothetical protein
LGDGRNEKRDLLILREDEDRNFGFWMLDGFDEGDE